MCESDAQTDLSASTAPPYPGYYALSARVRRRCAAAAARRTSSTRDTTRSHFTVAPLPPFHLTSVGPRLGSSHYPDTALKSARRQCTYGVAPVGPRYTIPHTRQNETVPPQCMHGPGYQDNRIMGVPCSQIDGAPTKPTLLVPHNQALGKMKEGKRSTPRSHSFICHACVNDDVILQRPWCFLQQMSQEIPERPKPPLSGRQREKS